MTEKLKNKDIVFLEIKKSEPITNSELAENLNMDLGNLGRYIKSLIKEGKINQKIGKKGKTRERINTINTEPIIRKEIKKAPEKKETIKKITIKPKEEKPKIDIKPSVRALRHILTEENLIRFIKEQERTKPYEMKICFYESSAYEIKQLLDKLFQKGLLKRNRNGWIYLKP